MYIFVKIVSIGKLVQYPAINQNISLAGAGEAKF